MTATMCEELQRWWRTFVSTGALPAGLEPVQGRLIRAVHRGCIGEVDVFVKTMTFPRAKDRLRYLLRPLPADHEAAMLRMAAAARVTCPEVLAAFTHRSGGLPCRSMLVLRALPVVAESAEEERRIEDEVALAMQLLGAGICHGDLHAENFVRLSTGPLAVLDLQSAHAFDPGGGGASRRRLQVAARMLREREGRSERLAVAAMRASGMLQSEAEVDSALALRNRVRRRYEDSRIRRCLLTSTEFERRLSWAGVGYRLRSAPAGGRWVHGPRGLRDAWIGQRILQLQAAEPALFGGFFQKWWWLGGGCSLYVSRPCSDDRIDAAVAAASAATRSLESARASQPRRSE